MIDDVQKAILKLSKNKAPGVDCLYVEHLIYAVNVISNLLCLFCIIHGYIPDSFTCSVIVSVFKDKLGDSSHCDNYRPISLVTMFSKVFKSYLSDKLLLEMHLMIFQMVSLVGKGVKRLSFL